MNGYTFRHGISAEEFSSFVRSFPFAPITQTEAWGKIKTDWEKCFCGIYGENGKLCGAALLLIRNIAPGFRLAYCPRGPLLDFADADVFGTFVAGIKAYAKKHGIYSVKIDPVIPLRVTPPELKNDEYLGLFDETRSEAARNGIFGAGFSHKGYSLVLNDYIQPRFNMIVPLLRADDSSLDAAALKKHLKSSERKYLGAFASNRGLFFEEAAVSPETVAAFAEIMKSTEARQKIYLRNKDYFFRLLSSFGSDAKLFFMKADVGKYIAYLKNRLVSESEPEKMKTSELLSAAEQTAVEKGGVVTLSASIVVLPPNSDGVRVAEYLYAGSDLSVFPSFCGADVMLYEIMLYCIGKDCGFLNLGGVEGTLDDGLYAFKSKFNPMLAEYIGEFDMVIGKTRYNIAEKNLPRAARLYRRLVSAFRKEKKNE